MVVPSSITTIVSATARRRRAIACSRVAPWAMIFAIIESNSGGTASPSATPVSTRTPGPDGSRSSVIRPGAGANPRAGSSAFRRTSIAWPRGGRRVALEPAAGRHVELEADEVGARDHLGDGVLDLQARVDLHEREALPLGLVEELDGAGAAVARVAREAHRRLGQLALLLGA